MPASAASVSAPLPETVVRARLDRDEWLRLGFVVVIALYRVVTLALPLGPMLARSFEHSQAQGVGLANYRTYFGTPALARSIRNGFVVSCVSTPFPVPLAFVDAYARTRSCMPGRGLLKTVALVPILVPSLVPGIALVYLFGNQGMVRRLLRGYRIDGSIGIVMAERFFTFPHALLIVLTARSLADARLYTSPSTSSSTP